MHLLRHIVEGMQRYGPVYGTWMYPFERFNSWISQRVLNRSSPEATVVETYRVSYVTSIIVILVIIMDCLIQKLLSRGLNRFLCVCGICTKV